MVVNSVNYFEGVAMVIEADVFIRLSVEGRCSSPFSGPRGFTSNDEHTKGPVFISLNPSIMYETLSPT